MYEELSVCGNVGFSSTSPMLFIVTVMDKAMVMAIMMITFTSSMVVYVCVYVWGGVCERERDSGFGLEKAVLFFMLCFLE